MPLSGGAVEDDLEIVELTKKHFGWLASEHGFKYDEKMNAFDNGYVRYRIERMDQIQPSIEVWLKSEPKYTRMDIDFLIDEYLNYSDMDKYLFEARLEHYSKLFRKHAHELFHDLDKLFLHGVKRLFINIISVDKSLTRDNYLNNLLPGSTKLYNYIKKKDRKWNPGRELQNGRSKL
jgi:hypothetical protein